ncbi:MAG: Na+/proline symporter [Burkholderiales bacterium]|nr:Na+/proline symporter [Burkholderiales bacterium]
MKLVDRVKNILIQPNTEWVIIESESTDPKALYLNYVAIVAVIPAAANFLSFVLFAGPFGTRVGVGTALAAAVTQYVLSLVMVLVVAFIADLLAPSFDGRKNFNQALKLTGYSLTAAWIAGVFVIIPGVGWLIVLIGTLYTLYLFFLGTQVMMKIPEQKAIGYTVVVVVVAIIVSFVIGMFQSAMLGRGPGGMMGAIPHL